MSDSGDTQGQDPAQVPVSAAAGVASASVPPGGWKPEHRIELLNRHPLRTRQYTIPTPMMQTAYRAVRERVYARRTGLVFVGKTRYGKTTCAQAVRLYLLDEFPRIHVVVVSARSTLRPVSGHVYRVILESEKHACASRSDASLLLRNVISDIEVNLQAKGGDQFVLVLDEVNLFNQSDMVNLMELSNLLHLRGICMTVISFGQPDVENLITSLQQQDKRQLIARFFRRPKSFDGCRSREDLEGLLRQLDEKTEWPEGSGWTYTDFFFPEAFRNNFRFYHFAELIWSELIEAVSDAENGLSMEAIAMTTEWLYLSLSGADREDFTLTSQNVRDAIGASDFD